MKKMLWLLVAMKLIGGAAFAAAATQTGAAADFTNFRTESSHRFSGSEGADCFGAEGAMRRANGFT